MPTTPIAGSGSSDAPVEITNTYQVGITPLSISAVFDGSGAAGDFIPCVSFYTQNNRLIGRYKGESTVTAGDTSQQTFAPFLGRDGGGIKFDTFPQSGDWLHVETTGTDPHTGNGVFVDSVQTVAIQSATKDVSLQAGRILTLDAADSAFTTTGADFQVDASDDINLNATDQVATLSGGDTVIRSQGDVISSAAGEYDITGHTAVAIQIVNVGGVIEFRDALNNPILRMTEGSPDLHIPTGGTVVADL